MKQKKKILMELHFLIWEDGNLNPSIKIMIIYYYQQLVNTLNSYFENDVLDMSKEIRYEGLWMNINGKG